MQTVPHDLGFILCPNTPCGLSSCSRTSPHFHCRFCTYGTSQIANAIAHGRMCSELPQKDYADALYSTTQPFSYYPPVSTTSTSSKLITTQQSTMLSFVLPSQNQFGGLYGPQTVFPNPNLFSPSSFNSFSQMDPSWVAQSRLLSNSGGAQTTSSEQGCCPLGVGSPDKVPSKELGSQNWAQPPSTQKYLDQSASCSISLLFLEHNKDTEECIDVDDICLTPKGKENEEEEEAKKTESTGDEKPFLAVTVKGEVEVVSSPVPFLTQEPLESSKKGPKAEELDLLSPDVEIKEVSDFDQPHSQTSNESDIVVEVSESESEPDLIAVPCCVCERVPSTNPFTPISEKYPLTYTSRTPIWRNIEKVLGKDLTPTVVCARCLKLINEIDSLESKLNMFFEELRGIYKSGKESVQPMPELIEIAACLDKGNSEFTPFVCECCGLSGFSSEKLIEKHIQMHQTGPELQCEVCGERFSNKTLLENHAEEHREKVSPDEKLDRKEYLKNQADIQKLGGFMCQHCGKRIKYSSNLRVHVRRCTGYLTHSCDKCHKKFPLKSLLERHISTDHRLNFKHHCKQCEKGFWKKSDLNSHLISHQKEKPFQCDTCGNSYKSKKNLNNHVKIHITSQCCRYCGKIFTRTDALTDHLNSHTGRQPYKCTKCGKMFGNRINYNTHVKLHLSEGLGVKCLVCKAVVCGSLNDHMKTHKDAPRFTCKLCSSVFAFKNSMVKHLRRKHGQTVISVQADGKINDIN